MQLSLGTAASLPNPGAFPSMARAQAGSPDSPITITLPATRQPEAPRGHRRSAAASSVSVLWRHLLVISIMSWRYLLPLLMCAWSTHQACCQHTQDRSTGSNTVPYVSIMRFYAYKESVKTS